MSPALEISLIALALSASMCLGFGAVAMAINLHRDLKEYWKATREQSGEMA